MAKMLSVFLIILLTGSFVSAQVINFLNNFKPGSEPDGFRGIKWGTDISTLRDMMTDKEEETGDPTKAYLRKGDALEIGGAKLKYIVYLFWRGKFESVLIMTKEGNANALKYSCFEKFGKGARMSSYSEKFQWDGKKAYMMFKMEPGDVGGLIIGSNEVGRQREEYEKEKAKDTTKKGF